MEPQDAVALAMDGGAHFCDVRLEETREQKLQIDDGELREQVAGVETGFGVRVLLAGAWGFASSNDLSDESWRNVVAQALRNARATPTRDPPVRLVDVPATVATEIWSPRIDPQDVDVADKQKLLAEMDQAAREFPEVKTVSTGYSDTTLRKVYANSDGSVIHWGLTRSVAQIHFTARRDGHLAGRSTRVGGTKGWELFAEEDPVEKTREAARSAVRALGAPTAKGGKTTVVIDPELAGVFAHEAVGHAAEADLVAIGESCFRGRRGDRLGIEGLRIHDTSLIPGAFGSFPFDDNGVPGQDKVLLENGILVGYLCDRERGAELDHPANGAARAQGYGHRPLVRMSNTMVDAGEHAEDEVFDVKEGIYCAGSRGGQVDTARGTYLFNAQDAWRIEDGELTQPLRDVSLTGDVLSTLHNIDALGNKQRLGDPGYCGKGQWVPVCDGGPLVRIRDCLVGGSQ